jgi:hypothetical protein
MMRFDCFAAIGKPKGVNGFLAAIVPVFLCV